MPFGQARANRVDALAESVTAIHNALAEPAPVRRSVPRTIYAAVLSGAAAQRDSAELPRPGCARLNCDRPVTLSELPPNRMTSPAAIILAAGQGKRMNSDLPKVLHTVCGRPLVEYVLDAARAAGAGRLVVVIGHRGDLVRDALRNERGVAFAVQARQLGTGDAVKAAAGLLERHQGPILVLAGDMPLVRSASLMRLLEEQRACGAACVVGTAITEQNAGLGRIVRDAGGAFLRIVEEKDATLEEQQIQEVNTGCYAFAGADLFPALDQLSPANQQAEYYLTDCAEILRRAGKTVIGLPCFEIAEALGVNTPEQLAEVERALVQRSSR